MNEKTFISVNNGPQEHNTHSLPERLEISCISAIQIVITVTFTFIHTAGGVMVAHAHGHAVTYLKQQSSSRATQRRAGSPLRCGGSSVTALLQIYC